METLKDILVNLLSVAIWAFGGFACAYFSILKKAGDCDLLLKKAE